MPINKFLRFYYTVLPQKYRGWPHIELRWLIEFFGGLTYTESLLEQDHEEYWNNKAKIINSYNIRTLATALKVSEGYILWYLMTQI